MKGIQAVKKRRPWRRRRSSSAPARPSQTQGLAVATTSIIPRESVQNDRIIPRAQKNASGPVATMNTTTIIAASKSTPSLARTSTGSLSGLNFSSLSSFTTETNRTTTSLDESYSTSTSTTTSSSSIEQTSSSRKLSTGASRPRKAGQEVARVESPKKHRMRRRRPTINSTEGFDPELFLSYLNDTLADPELDLESFLNIFRSVTSLFNSLGPVFTFVVGEMDEKLSVLDMLRKSSAKEHYRTVEGMVKYERSARLIEGNSNSGVRMQQRLQRALPFIAELLTKMDTVGPQEYLYPFVRDVYMRTLSNHHSWVIRKTIMFALRALPKRSEFEAVIMGSDPKNLEKWRQYSSQLEQAINKVYDASEKIYAKYKVPQLP